MNKKQNIKETEQVEESKVDGKVEAAEEEKPVEETKPTVDTNPAPSTIAITPISEDEPTYVDTVEEARVALHNKFNKTKTTSRILSIVVVAAMVAALILVVQQPAICKIFGYIIAGVILVGMLVFYIVTRKSFPNLSKEYIKTITTAINRHTYSDGKYSEVTYNSTEKFKLTDILPDRAYKDVIDIGSRNIIHGKFNKAPITVGELALYVAGEKRNSKVVCFLGYYGAKENNMHFEGRYIITKKGGGDKPSDLPTDVDDLEVLFSEGDFEIRGLKGADFKKELGSKFLSNLKGISIDGCFLNLNVVVTAGRTSFYMSYDDSLMGLPFEQPFDPKARNHFAIDLLAVLNSLELLKD